MDKRFSCNLCSFETHKSSNLKIHRKVHEKLGVGPPELIDCSMCDKSFISQRALNIHKKSHTDVSNEQSDNNKKCDKCPFVTHKTYNLNKHKKLHEKEPVESPEELVYKCDICPYENRNKFTLKNTN